MPYFRAPAKIWHPQALHSSQVTCNTFSSSLQHSASSRWPRFYMISIACRFYSIAAFLWVLFPLNSNFISSLCLSTGTMTSSQLGNLNGAFNLSNFCHVSILFLLIFILFLYLKHTTSATKRQDSLCTLLLTLAVCMGYIHV